MRQRWSVGMVALFRAALIGLVATVLLGWSSGVSGRTAGIVRTDVGPASSVGPLLGEQRWYGLLSYQLSDRLTLLVNVANGNLVVRQKDLSIKGTGHDLVLQQHYNSQAAAQGSIGNHWVLDTAPDVRLQPLTSGSVSLLAPSGYTDTFSPATGGGYLDPPGLDASLVKNSDGTYTLTFHQSGEQYSFSAAGVFTADVDKNGNAISFKYGSSGGLSSIVDTQGRTTNVASGSGGLISSITDPANRKYAFTYDGNGNLTGYGDPAGGTAGFAYDASSNLTQVTDPAGHVAKLSYDASHRVTAVAMVSDPSSGATVTTSFSYGSGPSAGTTTTTVTDPDQVKTAYSADSNGRTVQVVDAAGGTSTATYTANDDIATVKDPLGNQATVSHDARNNPTSVHLATGAQTTAAYGDTNHPYLRTGVTDTQGNTTQYAYDAAGDLSQVTDAAGKVTKYAYNSNGTLSSITDALGDVTTYGYDSAGNLTGIFPTGLDYTYDSVSRVATTTDPLSQKTTYAYDGLDRTTLVTYNDKSTASQSYDADGNRTRLVDASGTTTFAYDALDRLATKTLPSAEAITLAYTPAGALASRHDSGGTVSYQYNNLGLLASATDPTGAKTTFQYDADHRRTVAAYPNAVSLNYARDSAGDITSITAVNGSGQTLLQRQYSYANPANNQATLQRYTVSDGSSTTTYGYDALNRLTSAVVKNASGTVTDSRSYGYDAIGNRTSENINGTTTSITYDLSKGTITVGGITYTLDADGNVTQASDGQSTTTWSYNAANFTTGVSQTSQGCPSCPTEIISFSMTYSGLDQTQRVGLGSDGGPTTSYLYDPTGLVRQSDSTSTTYELRDVDQRLLSERTANGTYYVIPDASGSTIGLTDSAGKLVGTWVYDPWGQVLSQGGNVSTAFTFQGGFQDPFGIYKMSNRYYDPTMGRYMQVDNQQGSLSDPQTLNRYVFEGNDPTADPSVQQILNTVR